MSEVGRQRRGEGGISKTWICRLSNILPNKRLKGGRGGGGGGGGRGGGEEKEEEEEEDEKWDQ